MRPDRPEDEKAEYRRFVRAHHPDVGGDPEVFAEGIRRFQAARDRPAAPIVFVRRRRGLPGLIDSLRARHRRRHRPPRVR
ncbi:hypothetical protein FPZ12_029860 [Amycolatopsis acidicola]|uniref:J domain-containing protein n=1 Tax=Amycolatopsis acidicola TaxID=2596893 RepID=A0A5N0UXJ8_9PSEU|nr:hypothetical protein [Amycolatopsis acidicola]KAA9155395.1 hypothetical protein FPZ12_029860 [Amycolatopsis acidicola]